MKTENDIPETNLNKMKKQSIILSIIIALLVIILVYSNHYQNGFHFDDSHTIVENVHIRKIENIPAFFTDPKLFSNDPDHWGLRPLVTTTLAIDYWLGQGLDPFFFHLSTMVWFILLCIMLFMMYRNLLEKSVKHKWTSLLALFAMAWYGLHTANAETINYIISRSDVLSTFCIVASFLVYLVFPNLRKWYIYILPAILGVFAKETVPVLIILMFFYIIFFEHELSIKDLFDLKNWKFILNTVIKLLPLLITVTIAQIYTLSKISSIPGISNPFLPYLLTQSYVWLHYFLSFFLPLNLSADSDLTVIANATDERIIIGLIFVTLLIVAIVKTSSKKETRVVAFGLIWFAAALLPTSLAPFAEVTNDHRMFFPFIGLALSTVAYLGILLIKREDALNKNKTFFAIIAASVILVLGLNGFGVYERNKVWRTEESLWYDVTVKSPLNGRGLMNYGLTQMAKGNYAAADTYFMRALQYLPYYHTLYINIGVLRGATGNHVDAENNFKKAVLLSPNTFDSYVFYARYLQSIKRNPEAITLANKAVEINPYSTMALQVLMLAYNDLGLNDSTTQIAKRTLTIDPANTIALQFLESGIKNNQREVVKPIEEKKSKTAADFLNESLVYYQQKLYEKSIESCREALKIKPDYADAYNNICACYNELKQYEKAVEACTKALQIDGTHKLANGNLAWAKSQIKK